MVVPLDDLYIIIGLDLLKKVKMVLFPHLNGVHVMDEKAPCFTLCQGVVGESLGSSSRIDSLSASALSRGVRRGEPTFLALVAA